VSILRDHWSGSGVMHCFTGSTDQAEQALALGFHLSYGGVITFKTADNVRESARITPDERLLIETDAPYLAPIPHRGKRNEPAMMVQTIAKLAEIRATTPSRIGEITTANFERLCLRPRNPTR
jgi:TatD DNase family protein